VGGFNPAIDSNDAVSSQGIHHPDDGKADPRSHPHIRCELHEQAELTDASVRRITEAVNGPVRNRDGNSGEDSPDGG